MKRFSGTHTIHVARPPGDALWFFTPEGERPWGGGHWDPQYPDGPPPGDGAEPGTVFTALGATWVVLDRTPDRVRYARVTPDVWAGTVEVRLRPASEGGTYAEVTYDLTALSAEGAERLEHFAAHYEREIAEWETAIAAC